MPRDDMPSDPEDDLYDLRIPASEREGEIPLISLLKLVIGVVAVYRIVVLGMWLAGWEFPNGF